MNYHRTVDFGGFAGDFDPLAPGVTRTYEFRATCATVVSPALVNKLAYGGGAAADSVRRMTEALARRALPPRLPSIEYENALFSDLLPPRSE